MKQLLTIVLSLLLAGPAWADARKGLVEHMPTLQLPDCTSGNYTGMRAWDTTLGLEVTCDGTSWVPTVSGSGTVTDVFDCDGSVTADCDDIDLSDGDILDMGAVVVSDALEGLHLPGTAGGCTDWDAAEAEGQVCWDSTTDILYIGDGAAPVQIGPTVETGDIESVFDSAVCGSGACNTLQADATSKLDFGAVDAYTVGGNDVWFEFPQDVESDCAVNLVDSIPGKACYATNTERLYVGTTADQGGGARYKSISGDIEQVFSCDGPGTCTIVDVDDGQYLDFQGGTMNVSNNTEGLHLPGSPTNCGVGFAGEAEGQVCWDSALDELWVGTNGGSGTQVKVGPPAAGDITATELSDAVCSQVLWAITAGNTAGTTYMDLRDNGGGTDEDLEDNFLMPAVAMEVSNLACTASAPPNGATKSWTITVRNGIPGSLGDSLVTCTITNAETTCSDPVNTDTALVTEAITIGIVAANTPDAADLDCRMCLGN